MIFVLEIFANARTQKRFALNVAAISLCKQSLLGDLTGEAYAAGGWPQAPQREGPTRRDNVPGRKEDGAMKLY